MQTRTFLSPAFLPFVLHIKWSPTAKYASGAESISLAGVSGPESSLFMIVTQPGVQ